MKPEQKNVAIVHLIRASNDIRDATHFVDSYVRYPAGFNHNLIFLLKGFGTEVPEGLARILDRVPHRRLECPEGGYDIGSYYFAAERLAESVLVFFNSFSLIDGEEWLLKLVTAYRVAGVGLVGATGSWESLVSSLRIGPGGSWLHRALQRLKVMLVSGPLWVFFPIFPNPHVRSNAFLVARDDFLAIRPSRIRSKFQAWLFESGRRSMTRRLQRRGFSVRIVGRNGFAYSIDEWPESQTFWQSQQENLLVRDNRTMTYSRAGPALQAKLRGSAWNLP